MTSYWTVCLLLGNISVCSDVHQSKFRWKQILSLFVCVLLLIKRLVSCTDSTNREPHNTRLFLDGLFHDVKSHDVSAVCQLKEPVKKMYCRFTFVHGSHFSVHPLENRPPRPGRLQALGRQPFSQARLTGRATRPSFFSEHQTSTKEYR